MGRHEGWEPEAGGGHPLDKGVGVGRRLAVGLAHRRFDAELFGQPAEPDDGEFPGQGSLEGADAGSESMHKTITSFTFEVLGVRAGDYPDDGQDVVLAVGEAEIFNTPDKFGHSAPVSDSVQVSW